MNFRRIGRTMVCAILACAAAQLASAHPHVWVTMKTEVAYAPDGSASAIRHVWTFDDMYSAFAVQGLPHKNKGRFTREELASLAQVNMDSLKEFKFFTFAKADHKKVHFADPTDYWLEYAKSQLTLHFTLPFNAPAKPQTLKVDIYDPEIFVDFAFAKQDPVSLAGAPPTCKVDVEKPRELTVAEGQQLGEAFFTSLSNNWAAQFANKITVQCP